MGDVHRLILRHGVEVTRAQADSKQARQAIEAAALILADEENRLGITRAGFAMTSLPHKRIDAAFWRRQGNRTTLLVESGRDREGELIGVPHGSIARLILLYLQTEAVRTGNPEVELGRSMKAWMTRMSLSAGGKMYQLVAEQARRISACKLTFLPTSTKENCEATALCPKQHFFGRPRSRGQSARGGSPGAVRCDSKLIFMVEISGDPRAVE